MENGLLRKRDRLLFGVLLPIVTMAGGLFIIMLMDTSAGAAEFAALGIFLVAIAASPFVLIINSVVAFQNQQTRAECFKRGMIVPGLVMLVAFLYQLGLIDALF